MSINQEKKSLLSPEERTACQAVAANDEGLHRQRAVALLAVDDGATQAEAVVQSGLSIGQLKYCLAKFRKVRLDIFLDAPDAPPKLEVEAAAIGEEQPIVTTKEKKSKKSKKDKKKASGKKEKKSKKPKKQDAKKAGKKKKGKKSKKS